MLTPEVIGILGLVGLLVLAFLGVHIGIVLAAVGFFGLIALEGLSGALGALGTMPFYYSAEWAFVVLPMFLLLGNLAFHAGIGGDAYDAANKWLGRVPGGLAMATTGACAAFGFASGSSLATAAPVCS